MASPAQINANRLNSLKSTGPRTEEGKAASSANSYKHGLTARKIYAAARQEEFDLLARDYLEDYRPTTSEQRRVVDTMIFATWSLLRYRQIQEQLWGILTHIEGGEPKPLAQVFLDDCNGLRAIDRLHRYMRDLERSHARAKRDYDSERRSEQQAKVESRPSSPAPEKAAPVSDPAPRTSAPSTVSHVDGSPIPGIDFVSSGAFFIPPAPPKTARVTAPGYEHLSIRL